MIVRTSPTVIIDHGPWQPWSHADGPDFDVTTGRLDSADLERLDRTPPGPRRVCGILSEAEVQERRLRGAAATRARASHARVPDDVVIAALRATGGNAYRTAQMVGVTKQAVKQRLTTLDRLGLLPDDVYELVEARRRGA